jgi:zinc ribbon protein
MFCAQCGNEVEQHARFCSKCGQEVSALSVSAAPPQKKVDRDMNLHINILGWLLIGTGILSGMVGIIVVFASQIIQRLPVGIEHDIPVGVLPFAAWITSVISLAILALAAGTIAAGVGLLQYRDWARTVAIIVAVFSLFNFPIGTVISIYAFWVLFSQEGQEYWRSRCERTMTASGT